MKVRFSIDQDLEVSFEDSGRWRSYQLVATGNDVDELLADAHIAEVDQDGGEIAFYPLEETPNKIYDVAAKIIEDIGHIQKCYCGQEIDPNDNYDSEHCSESCFVEERAEFKAEGEV